MPLKCDPNEWKGDVLSGVDLGHVEDKAFRVSRRGEEPGVAGDLSQGKGRDLARDLADGHRADRQDDLAGMLVFDHLGLVLQAQVERWKSGRGIPGRTAFHQFRRENQAIHRCSAADCGVCLQAVASCDDADLRASSFSTAFIMTDGVVSALSRSTVRWRRTASLKRKPVSSSARASLPHSMLRQM